jgi:hypothetical protein
MSEVGQRGLIMTTCKCRENTNNLVMTRNYLDDLLNNKTRLARKQAMTDVLELLETHKNLWFSQSLNIGSGAFWSNKASTTQALITEIRKLTNE